MIERVPAPHMSVKLSGFSPAYLAEIEDLLGLGGVPSDSLDAYGPDVLAGRLGGTDPCRNACILQAVRERGPASFPGFDMSLVRLERTSLRLLRHVGVNPLEAVVQALTVANGLTAWDRSGTEHSFRFNWSAAETPVMVRGIVDIGGRVRWTEERITLNDTLLPATVIQQHVGGPLRHLVSHPVLDTLRLTIRRIETFAAHTHIVTDYAPSDVSIRLLVAGDMEANDEEGNAA